MRQASVELALVQNILGHVVVRFKFTGGFFEAVKLGFFLVPFSLTLSRIVCCIFVYG
jgi:hypothetical protein